MPTAIVRSAPPATVRCKLRSDTKMTAGRHLMDVAGTTAIAKHAIAQTSPSTIKKEVSPPEPPELVRGGSGTGKEALTAGRGVGAGTDVGRTAAFFG